MYYMEGHGSLSFSDWMTANDDAARILSAMDGPERMEQGPRNTLEGSKALDGLWAGIRHWGEIDDF